MRVLRNVGNDVRLHGVTSQKTIIMLTAVFSRICSCGWFVTSDGPICKRVERRSGIQERCGHESCVDDVMQLQSQSSSRP
jgi:hypothetical protein